jgi:hypothetical protein
VKHLPHAPIPRLPAHAFQSPSSVQRCASTPLSGMIHTCVLGACSCVPGPGSTREHGTDGSCAKPGHVGTVQHRVRHPNIEVADS